MRFAYRKSRDTNVASARRAVSLWRQRGLALGLVALGLVACASNPEGRGAVSDNLSAAPVLGSPGPNGGRFAPFWLDSFQAPSAATLHSLGLKFSAELFGGFSCREVFEYPCDQLLALGQEGIQECYEAAEQEADALCDLAGTYHFMELQNQGSSATVVVHRLASASAPGAELFRCSGAWGVGHSCTGPDGSALGPEQSVYASDFIMQGLDNFIDDSSPCDDHLPNDYYVGVAPPGAVNEMCYFAAGVDQIF